MADLDITDFMRPTGRLDYRRLQQHAAKTSAGEFVNIFKRPLLVGSAVNSGNLQEAAISNQTMYFKLNDVVSAGEIADNADCLQTAIFGLHKQIRGDGKPNIIKIGRANENDVVLNDYPISREHAFIRIAAPRYFLTDCGTTNGTTINNHPLAANVETELKCGDVIGFGRYCFHFMRADTLYKRLNRKL